MVSLEHTKGFYSGVFRLGDADNNITVDSTAKSITVTIDGSVVHQWA